MPGLYHSTWARTYYSTPIRYVQPTSIEEVQELVRDAARSKTTITVVGAAHSPSTLTVATGWLLNLDKLSRTLSFEPGQGHTDVTVEAGKRLFHLNEELAENGLALQNLGSISEQSVAGVISTGTHGSSAWHGLISEQVVDLTIVKADGELETVSDNENPELFKAILLSLGKFGIIVKATIRTVPAFNLESVQEVTTFERFLEEIWPTFFTSAEFHRIWWYPYTKKVVLWRANRTSKDCTLPPWSFYGTWFGRLMYEAFLWVTVFINPRWTPAVETWLFNNQFGLEDTYESERSERAVARSDQAINMDCLFSQFVNEWALPLTNGPEVLRELEAAINKQEFFVHAPFEIRVSNTTLPKEPLPSRKGAIVAGVPNVGPIYGNITRPYLDTSPKLPYAHPPDVKYENLTLNLNATIYRPFYFDSKTFEWFSAFETICANAGGKPHWAKNFLGTRVDPLVTLHHMRGIKDVIDEWYGDDVSKWRELRAKYDPDGVFHGNRAWLEINGLLDE